MSNNLSEFLKGIADSIRGKTGSSSLIDPQDFSTEIANIPLVSEKQKQLIDRTITTITAEDFGGATTIGEGAFSYCKSLTSITIPNNVTSIGGRAFEYCTSLPSIVIPNSVESIELMAFSGCNSLTSVYYLGDIVSWCEITFNGSSANPLEYAHNLYINNTLVTEITIPNTVTQIKAYTFDGWNGTSITIPNGVTAIGEGSFYGCSGLTSVTIPDSVTNIGGKAFMRCTGLTSVTIGSGITSIEGQGFIGCTGLTSITITAINPPALVATAFNLTNNCPIYVPYSEDHSVLAAYQSANNWSSYASRIQEIQS